MFLDETKHVIRLNVNDLVVNAPGSHGEGEQGIGLSRARMGTAVHETYLASQTADPTYRREAVVRWEGPWRDYTVIVEGRADGYRETPQGVVVEEIKSTLRSGALLEDLHLHPAHSDQCGFYCLILHWNGLKVAGGVVKYLPLSKGTGRDFPLAFNLEEWEQRFDERLSQRLDEMREQQDIARQRRECAARLVFPFDTVRSGQQKMMDSIQKVFEANSTLLCSAPTGTGKTAAALFPAVKCALMQDARLFLVTAKISQQELALETLRRIVPAGEGSFFALQMVARERCCPLEELNCMVDHCPYSDGFENRWMKSGILEKAFAAGVVDGGHVQKWARSQNLCPFEVSMALAQYASVIIADYNYVFDPSVTLRSIIDDSERPCLLIVDEAHNLPARGVDYYSPLLVLRDLEAVASLAAMASPDIYREAAALLDDVCHRLRLELNALAVERGEAPHYAAPPDQPFFLRIQELLEPLLYGYFVYLATGGTRPGNLQPVREKGRKRLQDPLLTALLAVRDFCYCSALDPELFATLWYRDGRVRMLCLDPAPLLKERHDLFNGRVFMSATLTPFDFYGRMLGIAPEASQTLELPSPFPSHNRLFLTVTTVDTTFKRRAEEAQSIADILDKTIRLRAGNYLAFFPSFAYRDTVVKHLPQDEYTILIQEPAMPTEKILDELLKNRKGTVLLCAVQGGVFSEGVDYPGHLAIGAFIIGPGLPQVSPEQELVKIYFDQHLKAGFEYAYVNPGMNRVVQSGGRVIRSETDCGFVMLLCRRFTGKLYRSRFPHYWQQEMVVTENPVEAVQSFWQDIDARN